MSSPRRNEIVEYAYDFVSEYGVSALSLRPVAEAAGSSTGVLRFLFGSKDGLVTALLDRARQDELELLAGLPEGGLAEAGNVLWKRLVAPRNRRLLVLLTECTAASLLDPEGAVASFAETSVRDWLTALAEVQPRASRRSATATAQRTAVLALLRGAVLDLLASGERARVTRAVTAGLAALA